MIISPFIAHFKSFLYPMWIQCSQNIVFVKCIIRFRDVLFSFFHQLGSVSRTDLKLFTKSICTEWRYANKVSRIIVKFVLLFKYCMLICFYICFSDNFFIKSQYYTRIQCNLITFMRMIIRLSKHFLIFICRKIAVQ